MAGARNANPQALFSGPDRYFLSGSFICADTAAPTVIRGDGFTVSAPTTGLYTITLTDGKFAGCDCILAWLAQATGEGSAVIVEGVPNTDVQSGFFQLETQSSLSTAANLDTPYEVHFLAVLRNTSLGRRSG